MSSEKRINSVIVRLFEKTVDAVLVNKWFYYDLPDNEVVYILTKGHEKEILEAAQKLEQESLKK